ncbi:hypothetical protein BZG36_03220 [Bifiguratus adelaidae]|uniref:Glutamyl-tRNA(Gln) amidotransferase subunit A, mitochondrial n=1 Tax=Bifiguratus adelaidae TaxID=1938954 RepID=A0A261XWV6_9FUNG|nr:hypothetical protein BZG36_03220 [Bifiguratus adelaidae]
MSALHAEAQAAQQRLDRGQPLSAFDGLGIAVKDNFCTSFLPTTCGSKMLEDFTSPYNATVVDLCLKAGTICVGKTNMDEFGMGSANAFSYFGPTINPHKSDTPRLAGGSSGGSAAAVASGMVFGALGSDTGGSVRLPASYCGIVGFKPSYGRCSRYGLVAYANSLDTVGLLTRTVEDAKVLYSLLDQYDINDPTSMPSELRNKVNVMTTRRRKMEARGDLTNVRIGIPKEYHVKELPESILRLWKKGIEHLKGLNATIVPISLPHTPYSLSCYYVLAPAEAASNLQRYDGVRYGYRSKTQSEERSPLYEDTRMEGFGEEVLRRILLGTYALTSEAFDNYYLQALKVRRLVRQDFDNVFALQNPLIQSDPNHDTPNDDNENTVDVILTPSAISTAPSMSEFSKLAGDPVHNYLNDVMTVPASLAGIPALSIPFGTDETDGLPVGLQLLSQYGDDEMLLSVGRVLQDV